MTVHRGTFTVLITPFTDGVSRVDEERLRQLVEYQVEEGIHGLVPLGSTGEFLSLSENERADVARIVVDQAAGRVPVFVGTAAESTDDAIRYSRQAEKLGADGVMIIPPFYSTPTEDELYEHYRRISDQIGIPIMLYNNPATANVDVKPALIARMAETTKVTYVKESTVDVRRIHQIKRLCGDRVQAFGGYMGYESFLVGADGWVSVCANVIPGPSARLFDLWDKHRDYDGARALFERINPMIEALGAHWYVQGTKACFDLMGAPMGLARPPRSLLPASVREEFRLVLEGLGMLTGSPPAAFGPRHRAAAE
ncbi:4-hydroxy-tetrahydrodipicolinate synthase [Stella humosa]|uniref:4-hydroxy-tetrahydrodipicolinate synthase n=1 Tax=Stella humosa TaxID=94 RepID=A0A3N1KQ69_9PROT|nr:dihydrodipicolinate synthase family protein [Stella humosa]ROP81437.1 4-hydroxy-tetrahydrodipicolinate synthase [Stella humosa]BBK32789.1 4-hydroxy-tetrahydrodipicolinate synthase [Stella humosa]